MKRSQRNERMPTITKMGTLQGARKEVTHLREAGVETDHLEEVPKDGSNSMNWYGIQILTFRTSYREKPKNL